MLDISATPQGRSTTLDTVRRLRGKMGAIFDRSFIHFSTSVLQLVQVCLLQARSACLSPLAVAFVVLVRFDRSLSLCYCC